MRDIDTDNTFVVNLSEEKNTNSNTNGNGLYTQSNSASAITAYGCDGTNNITIPNFGWTHTDIPNVAITTSWNESNYTAPYTFPSDVTFGGKVSIKGKNLIDTLDKIEQRLAILNPNVELESRWEELKELGEKYRELESQLLEKEKIWEKLKK